MYLLWYSGLLMEKLIIQSDKNNIIEVEKFVTVVCDTFNINNYAATISMSLLQAVENAIVHGNKNETDRTVTITADYCRGGVFFTVSDQGEGFDFEHYGKMPVNEDKGTGIYLMKTLSDKITFSDNGSTVRLDFFVNGIDPCQALERIMTLRKFYLPVTVNA